MSIPDLICCWKGLFLAGNARRHQKTGVSQFNRPDLALSRHRWFLAAIITGISLNCQADLVKVIKQIKPGIVGVGTIQKTRTPAAKLLGTGFVVSDGLHIVTNEHVISKKLDDQHKEQYVIFNGTGTDATIRSVSIVAIDKDHDLALLKFTGQRLTPLKLATDSLLNEGSLCAFTGFPIGAVLGLYPVTHRGIISAITPIASRVSNSRQLTADLINRLRDSFNVYQLDATAYPGNSGSPLYNVDTGKVIGVVNMVFVKESKETVLQKPSGISYAIPVRYVRRLLADKNLEP